VSGGKKILSRLSGHKLGQASAQHLPLGFDLTKPVRLPEIDFTGLGVAKALS